MPLGYVKGGNQVLIICSYEMVIFYIFDYVRWSSMAVLCLQD